MYFRKRGQRCFHVHVVSYEGALWNDNLILRNYLRAHKEEAFRYGEFKKQIMQKGALTLLDYSNQKNEFVREVLARVKAWHKANT
ncbi:GrpB family protein [Brevibacillus brevis]|nr:GrpB family protein [Brevibacillus brevis]